MEKLQRKALHLAFKWFYQLMRHCHQFGGVSVFVREHLLGDNGKIFLALLKACPQSSGCGLANRLFDMLK
ncbi:hypothetical protein T4E_3137 [Trichinella pseudospiralis]|uniref:Uncharacterized protein n=1 Tax=Trichinella pseudospiralis TaxID=6337 RepID=A0A0V0XZ66_TRIPS|nr:hypothetical protein T4E_3137 [Trichinella pseudospiralis]